MRILYALYFETSRTICVFYTYDLLFTEEYLIKEIATDDEELEAFLFSLGCYSGEPITVVSRLPGGCVVSIKDGRYNIDTDLAKAISI